MRHIESAIHRVPIFEDVGIKKVYNGAIAYTPDGNPIVGPAWDKPNFWLNEGHSFGITAAGGAGWQLAEWIVEGEPTVDMMGVDPRRFGPYATKSYLIEKNEEAYADVFEIHCEFTVQRESKDSFYMVSAGAYHRLDHDWLKKHMPKDGSVQFTDLTNAMGVLVVAGPKSRDLLQPITGSDLSNEMFPWLTGQETYVGHAPVKLLRVNFVGELGWEIHHPIEYQNHIFDALFKNGDKYGLKPFGIRAMNSMRLEKSYRLVGTEMSIEYSAYESGLHRFVNLKKKADFLGKKALLAWEKKGFDNAFVTLEVMDVDDADVIGNNPIYKDGDVIGRATGGGFGWRMNKSLALAMVHPAQSEVGNDLEIEILGKRYKCCVLEDSPHDPTNEKLRS